MGIDELTEQEYSVILQKTDPRLEHKRLLNALYHLDYFTGLNSGEEIADMLRVVPSEHFEYTCGALVPFIEDSKPPKGIEDLIGRVYSIVETTTKLGEDVEYVVDLLKNIRNVVSGPKWHYIAANIHKRKLAVDVLKVIDEATGDRAIHLIVASEKFDLLECSDGTLEIAKRAKEYLADGSYGLSSISAIPAGILDRAKKYDKILTEKPELKKRTGETFKYIKHYDMENAFMRSLQLWDRVVEMVENHPPEVLKFVHEIDLNIGGTLFMGDIVDSVKKNKELRGEKTSSNGDG